MATSMTATRAGEVQQPRRLGQDPAGLAQVGVDVAGGTVWPAGQQRPRDGQHHRIVVYVHHPGLRRAGLGYLVGVAGGRDAGADVQELADPGLAH
jgi:hypothetical protein